MNNLKSMTSVRLVWIDNVKVHMHWFYWGIVLPVIFVSCWTRMLNKFQHGWKERCKKKLVWGLVTGGTEEKTRGRAAGSRLGKFRPSLLVRPRRTGSAVRTPEGQPMLDSSGFKPREAIVGQWTEQKDVEIGIGSKEALRTKFIVWYWRTLQKVQNLTTADYCIFHGRDWGIFESLIRPHMSRLIWAVTVLHNKNLLRRSPYARMKLVIVSFSSIFSNFGVSVTLFHGSYQERPIQFPFQEQNSFRNRCNRLHWIRNNHLHCRLFTWFTSLLQYTSP